MDLVKLLPDRPAMDNGGLSAWLMEHGGRGREVLTYRKDKIRNPLTEQLEPVDHFQCAFVLCLHRSKRYAKKSHHP